MNEDLFTFLQKINPLKESLPLRSGGSLVDNNKNYLLKMLPELPDYKVYLLSILLQHQNIRVFTKDELVTVASLRLELLNDYSNATVPTVITNDDPLFDTGSNRVNTLISNKGLASLQINYMNARKIKSVKGFIEEII
jgi:hypothetical protein